MKTNIVILEDSIFGDLVTKESVDYKGILDLIEFKWCFTEKKFRIFLFDRILNFNDLEQNDE